ncbi:unnamed protein product [Symbiodinium natans]|uniref:Uncharacterized protein n=1 Tax=Symbiodinium natans TaxID=878477 RepID=A0A812RZ15_9DINO|nr:unnamed protein product [Symbiodinium natans]
MNLDVFNGSEQTKSERIRMRPIGFRVRFGVSSLQLFRPRKRMLVADRTVGAQHTEELLHKLRSSLFVETSFLEERPADAKCSSLDGPRCLLALSAGLPLDGPGVIPERILHDLGVDGPGVDFTTPEYMILEAHVRQASLVQELSQEPALLSGLDARAFLAHGRNATATGLLHFTGAQLDRRLPVTFSQGLPSNVVATFDGRWIARDCHSAGRAVAGLPQSVSDGALALPGVDVPIAAGLPNSEAVAEQQLSVSAELGGSIGYLRFSRPVSVRSLFARWAPPVGAPKALIGGRLGLQLVWTSHLDPERLQNERAWVDMGGGALDQVDELVFVAAQGLHVGAIGIASMGEVDLATSEEARTVMMLRPVTEAEDGQPPQFTLTMQRLRSDAAPFVASLQEVVDLNLRLRVSAPARALGGRRGEKVDGVLLGKREEECLHSLFQEQAKSQALSDAIDINMLRPGEAFKAAFIFGDADRLVHKWPFDAKARQVPAPVLRGILKRISRLGHLPSCPVLIGSHKAGCGCGFSDIYSGLPATSEDIATALS